MQPSWRRCQAHRRLDLPCPGAMPSRELRVHPRALMRAAFQRSPTHPASLATANLSVPKQEFKGYVFKIMGGQDKQGFPMKQGVLTNGRVQVR